VATNEDNLIRKSLGAAAGATFFLLLGLGVVWFARKVAGVNDGVVLSALVIIPALLYVVLRGDLAFSYCELVSREINADPRI